MAVAASVDSVVAADSVGTAATEAAATEVVAMEAAALEVGSEAA